MIGAVSVLAQDKVIRLRNQAISTPPKSAARLQPQAVESPASGLFLIQFNDRLQPAWREQLRQMRVELVRYVPDDAFVARFDAVSPGQVTQLSFVRWVGLFRPEHKIDSRSFGKGPGNSSPLRANLRAGNETPLWQYSQR